METAYKTDFGVEIGLFDKVEIIADYFSERRKNILMTRAHVPSFIGLQTNPSANVGEAKVMVLKPLLITTTLFPMVCG